MSLLTLSAEELEARVVELGGRPFHARSIRRHVFERGALSYEPMTDLSAALRERLAVELPLLTAREEARSVAADGTTKLLLTLADGATLETVHIPSRRAGSGATLCVSSQVGCPVGCPFCASGQLGLKRNLAAHEIVEQYLRGRDLGPLSRSVVMGIGEPLLNARNLLAALTLVHDELGLGARRITVSTVGFPDRLRRLAPERPPFQLAISLHSPDQEQRDRLVPAMAGTPIDEVLAAGDFWFEQTGREVTYEYALLGGENDDAAHADRLAARLRGRRATVNLIPYNPVAPLPFKRPRPDAVRRFRERLEASGLVATVRWSRGLEADAACGQLRLAHAAGGA
ncbi:MAG: 23S rRNA (adenine(2503)-C(2))-methyltransferase RlmN [Planctomycetota bacterium]